jgi:hypothetical protein
MMVFGLITARLLSSATGIMRQYELTWAHSFHVLVVSTSSLAGEYYMAQNNDHLLTSGSLVLALASLYPLPSLTDALINPIPATATNTGALC